MHGADFGAQLQGVVVRHLRGVRGLRGEHREILDELLPTGRPGPAGGDAPDRGEQVGAYGVLGSRTAAHRLKHAGEHLGGESSAVWASRQQVRAYRRTASAWRRYSSS